MRGLMMFLFVFLCVPFVSAQSFSAEVDRTAGYDIEKVDDNGAAFSTAGGMALDALDWDCVGWCPSGVDDIRVPCTAAYDACKSLYVVNVGDFWGGWFHETRYLYPDAYYSGYPDPDDECVYGQSVGDLSRSTAGLYLFLGYQAVIADWPVSGQTSTLVRTDLYVSEYTGGTCSGTALRSFTDYQDCLASAGPAGSNGYTQIQAAGGIGSCTVEYNNETVDWCHGSDVKITAPAANGTKSYGYEIRTQVCYGNETNCSTWQSQSGCFAVDWIS